MPTTELLCNNCGAPLDVPPTAKYATCAHCGSQLSVYRNDSAAWTEVVEKIAADTGRIGEGVTLLTVQAELERLDREWQMQQPQSRPEGRRRRNGKDDSPLGMLIGLAIPLFVLYMIFGKGNPSATFLVLAILGIAAVVALRTGALNNLFGTNLTADDYQRRRAELVRRIDELGGTL